MLYGSLILRLVNKTSQQKDAELKRDEMSQKRKQLEDALGELGGNKTPKKRTGKTKK